MTSPVLSIRGLRVSFRGQRRNAVDDVDLDVLPGERLAIVGESGSGKSVTALSILGLAEGANVSGEIRYGGRNLLSLSEADLQKVRGKDIAMIFQEPMTALNPLRSIGYQIMESLVAHAGLSKPEASVKALELLAKTAIRDPEKQLTRYPHQLSGGQRQRAVIAMALCCQPSLLIADEPTTALDVTTEAQILELMLELQQDLGMAMQYITHNLGVVAELADDVMVMYLGKPVEMAPVEELFFNPLHPYTRALLRSIPQLGKKQHQRLESIKGMVPDPYSIPAGCAFHPRCPRYRPGVCDDPEYRQVTPGHWVRCARAEEPWE